MLRTEPGASNELLEATAALQDLAYRFALAADPESARSRLAELAIQAELPRAVGTARNGPPPRDQRRAARELAGRAALVAADGALPLRGLGAQAFL